MSCIDRKQQRKFHETCSIIWTCFCRILKKQNTYFSHGYSYSSIDLIADFYYKKLKIVWQSLKEPGSASQV